jgi:hypothetical protein
LFALTASATERTVQASVFQGQIIGNGATIPNNQITVGGKQLGSDGIAWRMYPDAGTFDVTPKASAPLYTFGVGQTKFSPYINANGHNLDNETPEFCVGQKVSFGMGWEPSSPSTASSSYIWALAGTFVNRDTPGSGGASDTWDIDPDSLNSAGPFGYWITDGNKNAYLHETLYFSNGQSATVFASGQFNMFKPSVTITYYPPYYVYDDGNLVSLGNRFTGDGVMDFKATVTSKPKFPGYINWTQLVNANSPSFYSYGQYWLDNTTRYNDADGIVNPTGETELIDSPGEPVLNSAHIFEQFDSYLRFYPDSGGIWVTLKIVHWSWLADVSQPTLTHASVGTPYDTDSDTFPEWPNVLTNPNP